MENKRGFEIKYLGATDTKGSRVKIKDLRNKVSKIISYDYSYNNIYDMAEAWLNGHCITIEGCIETDKGYILTSDNFTDMIN